ncbi:glyoxylate/hydroxypyruvate reductase A [Afifella sp. IM 167]|nr:glyoxylate/hydroxypyruvate reductase A [Afifella sp. IM 167]
MREAQDEESGLGALVFYSEFDDPAEWADALRAYLPELDIRVWPEVGEVSEIHYALVWRPPSGFFEPFEALKLVVNLGAGVDSLTGRPDLPDLPISRLSDAGMVAMMRSYILFAVTRYARDIPEFEAAKRLGEWRYIHPRPLSSTKVGILGLGILGSAAAEALAWLGYDVRGFDRREKSLKGVTSFHREEDFGAFLGELDILVNMLPLTPDTRSRIGPDVFSALPQGAKFINASRGEVVDEPALLEALSSGHLGGATLDVFWQEPLPKDHPFWAMENVFITPHLASITVPQDAARDVAESIRRVHGGERPLHEVNPKLGY